MSKATVSIFRNSQDNKQTSGVCTIEDENGFILFSSVSLERGWMNNQKKVSCLPKGTYPLVYEYSNRFKRKLWEIKETGSRSECKFHSAAYWYHLQGCISLGLEFDELNNDDYFDLKYSSIAMDSFHNVLSKFDEVELIIDGNFDTK